MNGRTSRTTEELAAALLSPALGLLRTSAHALATLFDPDGEPAWRELADKLEAFDDFQRAADLLASPQGRPALSEGVARARKLEPWTRLWVLEGWGYAAGRAAAEGLLADLPLPAPAMIPLHSGVGLALAAQAVEEADRTSLDSAVRAFAARCRATARAGAEEAMLEALGLAARTLRPERVGEIACFLGSFEGGRLAPCFWHGVGRALYFVPSHLLPWDRTGAIREAAGEPPSTGGKLNAMAGLAWATTLVGLRHPEILDRFLGRCDGWEAQAAEHGIAAAVVVWVHANGRDDLLAHFLGYRAADLLRWRKRVVNPCERSLARQLAPAMEGRFGQLFRVGEGSVP